MSRFSVIDSRRNPRLKRLKVAANDPRKAGLALAEGLHLVGECLARGPRPELLLLAEGADRRPDIARLVARSGEVEILIVTDGLFRDITGVTAPAGIAAAFVPPQARERSAGNDTVLLEAIQDPGNVGAILRTAAAAGIGHVFLSQGCASAWSLKVLRAGQGAHFSLNIVERADLASVLAACGTASVATVVRGGRSLYDLDLVPPLAWLFGSEGSGLSTGLTDVATWKATIPLTQDTESLNVAAATAVCLFEARRQRLKTKKPA